MKIIDAILNIFRNDENRSNVAVYYDGVSMTYETLAKQVDILGNYLIQSGCSNQPVGFCFRRGFNNIVAMLGIQKAGCFYVPLDMNYPIHRLQYITKDTKLNVILTDYEYEDISTFGTDINIIKVQNDGKDLIISCKNDGLTNTVNNKTDTDNSDLAYIIYTSGTTGDPKGVMIRQDALTNLINSAIRILKIKKGSRIFQYCSIGFDAAGWDIYCALLSRSAIYMATENMMVSPTDCYKYIIEHRITMMTVTPAFLANMPLSSDEIQFLRILIVMGDMADSKNMDFWCKHSAVYNGYGPTETTIGATIHRYDVGDTASNIGTPFDNYEIYIMNDNLEVVEDGESGEMCIGGMGVAKGYWNQEELTRKKFVDTKYGRLYRTGDIAKCQNILSKNKKEYLFLGRKDNQIKINGIRIELEDIESHITSLEYINMACAVYDKDNKRVVVYYTSKLDKESDKNISKYLETKLHKAVVPRHYEKINEFPLTLNGKIDKKKLPKYEMKQKSVTPPSTYYEKMVVESYKKFAQNYLIGLETDFFDIGGTSLNSVKIVKYLGDRGFKIEPLDILKNSTVKVLAEFIETNRNYKNNEKSEIDILDDSIDENNMVKLSPIQKNLLDFQRIYPKDPSYNTITCFELRGVNGSILDVDKLVSSIKYLINKHHALRTKIMEKSVGEFVQRFDMADITINILDIMRKDVMDEIKRTLDQPFKILETSLIRIRLLKIIDEECHILTIVKHNIITDAYSESIIIRDLQHIYNNSHYSVSDNENHNKKMKESKYVEYLVETNRKFKNTCFMEYWKEKLQNYVPVVLPKIPKIQKIQKITNTQTVSSEKEYESESIRSIKKLIHVPNLSEFTKSNHKTSYNILLTAFTILISRYANSSDITIGTQIANRWDPRWSDTVGFMVSTLVLRNKVGKTDTVSDLSKQIMENMFEAIDNRYITYDDITRICGSKIDIMFVMQNSNTKTTMDSMNKMNLNNIESTSIEIETNTQAFPLYVDIYPETNNEDSHTIHVRYSEDYDKIFISDMLRSYEIILEDIVENFYSKISDIKSSDFDKVLEGEKESWDSITSVKTLDVRIFNQVRNKGESIAIKHSTGDADYLNESMSYEELFTSVNKIEMCLTKKYNISPKDVVGVKMNRGVKFVSLILAILKAGACYVPIDPNYPKDRIDDIVEDSKPKIVVCSALKEDDPIFYCDIDDILKESKHYKYEYSDEKYVSRSEPDNLAYIIYTSGSTGKPKGCMITHKSVINVINHFIKQLNITDLDKIWSLTTISFDIMVLEIFMPLVAGCQLLICPQCVVSNPVSLVDWINKEKPTVLQATPTQLSIIVDHIAPNNQMTILVGGEAITAKIIKSLLLVTQTIYNVYGPSETTIWSTAKKIDPLNFDSDKSASIGKPISNTQCVVLNEDNKSVPSGCVGELCIGGEGVSVGYLNRPELTKSKFIIYKGNRFYKTGDLVRINRSDELEYIGRTDFQVKIRGHRVELEEIISVMEKHKSVKRAIVIAKNNTLISYYVGEEDGSIIDYMRERLPHYMIPGFTIWIPRFPETFNGKIDVKMLQDPFDLHQNKSPIIFVRSVNHVEPRTETERILHDIMKNIIGCDSISVTNSILNVGAVSITYQPIVTKINSIFSVNKTIEDLIKNSTIESFAKLLS